MNLAEKTSPGSAFGRATLSWEERGLDLMGDYE